MSASLVGSEMCIRDRHHRPPWALRNALSGGGLSCTSSCATGAEKGPVSYTHLTLPTICSV
eukprot:10300934-Alexandrium_andersonii.AAC.1